MVGQGEMKGGAFSRFGFGRNAAAVALDDPLYNGQSDT